MEWKELFKKITQLCMGWRWGVEGGNGQQGGLVICELGCLKTCMWRLPW